MPNRKNKKDYKNKCQKFTPMLMVHDMLDLAGYSNGIVGKKILENSFGCGNFLEAIVARYINDGIRNGLTIEDIRAGLSNDIYGFEIDKELYISTIERLNRVTIEYGMKEVKWKLFNSDYLSWNENIKFDFIIGNPPYLNYKDIETIERNAIRLKFIACSAGKFDYCYAFLEKGYTSLKNEGVMVQLIPANIYKNVFGKELRKLIRNDVEDIFEFQNQNLFDDTMTVSSVVKLKKNSHCEYINYKKSFNDNGQLIKKTFLKDKWVFTTGQGITSDEMFGRYFAASIAVATQLNEAFVIDKKTITDKQLEKKSYRPAASPKGRRTNREEYIIFPYTYKDGLIKYEESDFKKKYPNTYLHLINYKEDLDKRKKDKCAKWYEYGRSQALKHLNQKKLLISTVITNEVKVYPLKKNEIPYAGIYITVLDDRFTLDDAQEILTSDRFMKYVNEIGTSVNGESKRITCVDIRKFDITEWLNEKA